MMSGEDAQILGLRNFSVADALVNFSGAAVHAG
jgi:hypothetical protein